MRTVSLQVTHHNKEYNVTATALVAVRQITYTMSQYIYALLYFNIIQYSQIPGGPNHGHLIL